MSLPTSSRIDSFRMWYRSPLLEMNPIGLASEHANRLKISKYVRFGLVLQKASRLSTRSYPQKDRIAHQIVPLGLQLGVLVLLDRLTGNVETHVPELPGSLLLTQQSVEFATRALHMMRQS